MQTEREIKEEDKEEVNLIYLSEQQHGEHRRPSEVQEAAFEFNQPGL